MHLRRWHFLGGEWSKIVKICRRRKWMFPIILSSHTYLTITQIEQKTAIIR
jgi:hypothetical protein